MSLLPQLILCAGIISGVLGLIYWLHNTGENSEKLKQAEASLDEIKKANDARMSVKPTDSLRNDPFNRDV